MALSYNLGKQESISVHPTRRQNFAGKPYSNFPNTWEWLICDWIVAGWVLAAPRRAVWLLFPPADQALRHQHSFKLKLFTNQRVCVTLLMTWTPFRFSQEFGNAVFKLIEAVFSWFRNGKSCVLSCLFWSVLGQLYLLVSYCNIFVIEFHCLHSVFGLLVIIPVLKIQIWK